MLEALSVVDACCRIILAAKPSWWVLENPLRRRLHEVHMPVGGLQPARQDAGPGDGGKQDAPAGAES